jgi:hypothetical protein
VAGKGAGEHSLARPMLAGLDEDWLLIADRNFYNLTWLTVTEFRRARHADLRVPGSGWADLRTKSGRKVGPCLRTCGR